MVLWCSSRACLSHCAPAESSSLVVQQPFATGYVARSLYTNEDACLRGEQYSTLNTYWAPQIPKLLTASTGREIISCMKSFYYLKFKTKQNRNIKGKVVFKHMNENNRGFISIFFSNILLSSEKSELL